MNFANVVEVSPFKGVTGHKHSLGYQMPLHFGIPDERPDAEQPRFALHYVQKGACTVLLGEKTVSLVAPAVVLADELVPWSFVRRFECQTTTLYFHPSVVNSAFTPQNLREGAFEGTDHQDLFLMDPFFTGAPETRCRPVSVTLQQRIEEAFGRIRVESELQEHPYWPCRTRSILMELLVTLRMTETPAASLTGAPQTDESSANGAYARAFEYVRTRFTEDFSVPWLAQWAGSNRTTLNAEFRRRTGHSIHSYTIALRLDLAASLLRDTELSVGEITRQVGYEDQSHFGRIFQDRFGISPARYREESVPACG